MKYVNNICDLQYSCHFIDFFKTFAPFTSHTCVVVFRFSSATATGFSSGLENRAGGRCSSSGGDTYEMKLKLRVCPKGEAGTAKCPVCMDSACYNSGEFTNLCRDPRYFNGSVSALGLVMPG